jgi:hypothetical protein
MISFRLGQALMIHDDSQKVAQLRDHIDAGGDGVEDFELLVGRDRGVRQDSRNTSLSARVSLKSYQ